MLPAAHFYKRAGFPLKKIVEYAAKREYSDVLVVNEDRKSVNGLLVVHLPAGPSVHFKLSKLVLGADIPVRVPLLGTEPWESTVLRCLCRMFAWQKHVFVLCRALNGVTTAANTVDKDNSTWSRRLVGAGTWAADFPQAGADPEQFRHDAGPPRGTAVCVAVLSGPKLPGPAGGHLPQPAGLHLFQAG